MVGNKTLLSCAALLTFFVTSFANADWVPLVGTNWEYDTTPGVSFTLTGGGGQTTGDPWLVTESYFDPPNDNPIVTHWRQATVPVENGDNYFAISLERANICEWTSYNWTITDDNGVPQGTGDNMPAHPDAAHFHSPPLTQYAPFMTKTPTGSDGVYSITVSNGPLPANSFWNAGVLKVHDYDNYTPAGAEMSVKGGTPGATAFTITETPVPNCIPEPGTFGLLAVGLLGIAGPALRRWRRRSA